MSTVAELDPVAIRQALTLHREAGLQFDQAWQQTIGDYSVPDYEREVYKFMRVNFRAAYYPDDDSAQGRCFIPERDVSMAPIMAGRPVRSSDRKRCRSGDGCDRLATDGRFGKTFCGYHGGELQRLAAVLKLDRDIANPRLNGNGKIPGLKSRAA